MPSSVTEHKNGYMEYICLSEYDFDVNKGMKHVHIATDLETASHLEVQWDISPVNLSNFNRMTGYEIP